MSFSVIATKQESNTVGIDWASAGIDDPWVVQMACFDAVPAPARVAGTTLTNGNGEVFVTASCGLVYGRRIGSDGWWTPWLTVALPTPTSAASDVAVSIAPGGVNCLYIADSGTVFMRCRLDAASDPFAKYDAWHEVATGAGSVVAAGTRADGRQQVFTIDADGHPLTTIQSELALASEFAAFSDFDSDGLPPLVDIEAPYGLPALEIYALDADGNVWTRKEVDTAFTAWKTWAIGGTHGKFHGLAGGAVIGTWGAYFLIAAAADDCVYEARRQSGTWEDWLLLE
jgi:hypothetical protein